jgi:cellulose synthase/poly-beta-1,6-N-acetylglucosamine synthase-like glycosyltransferase
VVVLVIAVVVSATAIALAVGIATANTEFSATFRTVALGPIQLTVSDSGPSAGLVWLAGISIVIVALIALAFEGITALLSARPRRKVLSARRHGRRMLPPAGPVRITVLVPAHNEEASLPATLDSLEAQTRAPDRIIVVADNCTDGTVRIAHDRGYDVFESVDNVHKKGGALNQVLARLLNEAMPEDAFLVMDADTQLGHEYLAIAGQALDDDPELAAVGGVFFGEGGHGVLGQFQRNEYTRYSAEIRRRRGRVFVLTGTASVFRSEALLDVSAARGVYIPGTPGTVYDTAALTEDNELTLALKSLGSSLISPPECTVTTELMPTWRDLWTQRKRWQRGALENLSAYGITPGTVRYWGQQVGIGYGTVALISAMALMLITFLALDQWVWFPFWVIIGSVFWLERVITAWSGGWRARVLAALLIPELFYDVYLQMVFVACLKDIVLGRDTQWGHVQHAQAPGEVQ